MSFLSWIENNTRLFDLQVMLAARIIFYPKNTSHWFWIKVTIGSKFKDGIYGSGGICKKILQKKKVNST